jgi:hypothetical protein
MTKMKKKEYIHHGREVPYSLRPLHPSASNLGALAIIMNFSIVLPELQRFYGRAIVIITPVEMPRSDINRPLSIINFVLYLSLYRIVLGRIYD